MAPKGSSLFDLVLRLDYLWLGFTKLPSIDDLGVEKMAKTMLMQKIATARDKLMAFFYFKIDRNDALQYAVILLNAQTLKKKHIFGGFDHTKSRLKNIPNLAELAKLALEFGFSDEAHRSVEICKKIISVIKHCGNLMSLIEEDKEKKYVDGLHPMISHIIDHSDFIANFSHLQIGSCSAGDLTHAGVQI
ncbi:unnamed protein product [Arabis nemorensis]|uniref:Uncharacterized protein n=1 Tax=Arabis nemorensis TaxID=586526 RepID=A0A565ATA4_9BRAS|nr:unnamed protein product [Arabis nemorensis]